MLLPTDTPTPLRKVSCLKVGSGVFPQFMQRGLDAETKKQLEEDEKRIISDEHWYLDLPELKAKEYVPSRSIPTANSIQKYGSLIPLSLNLHT